MEDYVRVEGNLEGVRLLSWISLTVLLRMQRWSGIKMIGSVYSYG